MELAGVTSGLVLVKEDFDPFSARWSIFLPRIGVPSGGDTKRRHKFSSALVLVKCPDRDVDR